MANSAGRFMDQKALRGRSVPQTIDEDLRQFVMDQAEGLEMLGATRTRTLTWGLSFRETNAAGKQIVPMFQRDDFNWHLHDTDPG